MKNFNPSLTLVAHEKTQTPPQGAAYISLYQSEICDLYFYVHTLMHTYQFHNPRNCIIKCILYGC